MGTQETIQNDAGDLWMMNQFTQARILQTNNKQSGQQGYHNI